MVCVLHITMVLSPLKFYTIAEYMLDSQDIECQLKHMIFNLDLD